MEVAVFCGGLSWEADEAAEAAAETDEAAGAAAETDEAAGVEVLLLVRSLCLVLNPAADEVVLAARATASAEVLTVCVSFVLGDSLPWLAFLLEVVADLLIRG